MRIIDEEQFDSYWKNLSKSGEDPRLEKAVRDIIADIRSEGDAALFRYTERFDRCLPRQFEVSPEKVLAAWEDLRGREPRLAAALELSADHIRRFASIQRSQFTDFETE
ncbi:MAG: histidinol dehydrogenase, partial [Treponema sp.]|nr:histidinol dehydrogenase [Treponema sp.]